MGLATGSHEMTHELPDTSMFEARSRLADGGNTYIATRHLSSRNDRAVLLRLFELSPSNIRLDTVALNS